ncbi:MAG TPA: hypothetical protein VKS25_06315, partial [Solirubrobacteraceae bacterium]|nr:hypothetical protein [Solirubrobacteraceae bacterium]
NLDADATEPQAAGPGHWNDPDYLGPDQGMNAAQFRTQFSMWAMLAAPLMVSDNMTKISAASLNTVTNKRVIAIDQDPAGAQGVEVSASGNGEVWAKPLIHSNMAIALLNRSSSAISISTSAAALASDGLPSAGSYHVTNLWSGAASTSNGTFSAQVPAYSTVLLQVSAG